jgi:hypothetical protein
MIEKHCLRSVFHYMSGPQRCRKSFCDREAGSRKFLSDGDEIMRDDN